MKLRQIKIPLYKDWNRKGDLSGQSWIILYTDTLIVAKKVRWPETYSRQDQPDRVINTVLTIHNRYYQHDG